ncbi:MAG: hypothetical protein KDB86_00305 [Actinobacteria bacterium]|nr:hypothetical protein [Actinomycetota bacterium]
MNQLLELYIEADFFRRSFVDRIQGDERGEGVVSAAIAVLIFAFLGAAMWVAFSGIFDGAADKTQEQINQIGS